MQVKTHPKTIRPGQQFEARPKSGHSGPDVAATCHRYNHVFSRMECKNGGPDLSTDQYDFYTEMTHPKLVYDLAKTGQSILNSLTPVKCHLLHMVSCVMGEAAELLEGLMAFEEDMNEAAWKANALEEMGDICFYLEGFCNVLNIPHVEVQVENTDEIGPCNMVARLIVAAGDLFDAVKKHLFYEKPLDREAVAKPVVEIETVMAELRGNFGFTRQQVLDGNITKLMKRYPEGYSNEAALERADKAPTLICGTPEECRANMDKHANKPGGISDREWAAQDPGKREAQ